jgi:CheY-like chemotaxis protein
MKQMTILIVEDMPEILELIIRITRDILPSAQLLTADNGEEGLSKARQQRPDLIITGLTMPKMNGLRMVRLLRQEDWGYRVPIIGLSGNDPYKFSTLAFRRVCDRFLNKPFLSYQLRQTIHSVLHEKLFNPDYPAGVMHQPDKSGPDFRPGL